MDPRTHSHAHDIKGNSNTGYSQLTLSGGSDEHENRPPYYVVAYIIFLGWPNDETWGISSKNLYFNKEDL